MAQIRSSRFWYAWTGALGGAFLLGVILLTFWGWKGGTADPYVKPIDVSDLQATPSEAPRVIVHPAPLDAKAYTESSAQAASAGWLLIEYDTSAGAFRAPTIAVTPEPDPLTGETPPPQIVETSGEGEWEIPGSRYLYAVDPSGAVYEAADLGADADFRLLAWLPDHRTAIVAQRIRGGRATLHSVDLIDGGVSPAFDGPDGSSAGTWSEPTVEVTRDQKALLVQHGGGQRGLALLEFDGTFITEAMPPATGGAYIQAPGDRWYIVRERVQTDGEDEWAIVSYQPTGDHEPESTTYIRTYHERPPGEGDCYPAVWPLGRQLIVRCNQADATSQLYTLALTTTTYADGPEIKWSGAEGEMQFDEDGTRVVTPRVVFDVFGEPLWVLPVEAATTSHVAWAGEHVAMWGDAEAASGYGAAFVRLHHARDGEVAYLLSAYEGAAGILDVVPAI